MEGNDLTQHAQNHDAESFAIYWDRLAERIHQTAIDKGFWKDEGVKASPEYMDDHKLLRIVSEVSELSEFLRDGNPPSEKMPEFLGSEEEGADIVIRLMDLFKRRGWRIAQAIQKKMSVNDTRPELHGRIRG